MEFQPNGHFSGNVQGAVDLTAPRPWIYIIACLRSEVVYIGETCDRGGLVVRLGSHFGPYPGSSLRQAAAKTVGISSLKAPFIVVAAQLPVDEPDSRFNGDSRKERQWCEVLVHSNVSRNLLGEFPKWAIVSTAKSPSVGESEDIVSASESISKCFFSALKFLGRLRPHSPFNLVTLGTKTETLGEVEIGTLLNRIEIKLFEWLLDRLKDNYADSWWGKGVPTEVRKRCATASEDENVGLPPEAYLTFVDLRRIIQSNWSIFGSALEKATGERGKERTTSWLVRLNDVRKVWAHPIKQRFNEDLAPRSAALTRYLEIVMSLR